MSTTGTAQMSRKDKIKALRRDLAPLIKDVQTAEAVLASAQQAASPMISSLLQLSGMPQQRITMNRGEASEERVIATFRKIGDYTDSADGKIRPLYGIKILDMSDDDDD